MRRLDDPGELGAHLAENARAWREILDGTDASPLEVFGRVEALSLVWAALQREVLTPLGVNYAELATLGMLRTAPDARISLAQLRRLVGQSSAGTTRILDKLEAEGCVRREEPEDDRRRIDVLLTERGADLAEIALRALLAAQTEILAKLEWGERELLVTGLDALMRGMAERRG